MGVKKLLKYEDKQEVLSTQEWRLMAVYRTWNADDNLRVLGICRHCCCCFVDLRATENNSLVRLLAGRHGEIADLTKSS